MPSRFPVDLGSVRDPDAQVGRLHRLAVAGGPSWVLARLLRRGERLAPGGGCSFSNCVPGTCCVPGSDLRWRFNLASGLLGMKSSDV
jgi:hypothetical protein